jgi:cation diffusion facilitator CzcD-associated flavoprotein CzcO/isoprenylcysteine carboxyl methyltransferase (ICMT) family protein YpbQ
MDTKIVFSAIVCAVAAELLLLSWLSRRNVTKLTANGAIVVDGSGVGTLNILLRAGWIAGMLAEVFAFDRPFLPVVAAISALATIAALGLRLASIYALGERWTLPTVVVPSSPPVRCGVYAYFRHPNWIGVVIEIVSIPLLHGAIWTAAIFLVLELLLLRRRAAVEDSALAAAAAWSEDTTTIVTERKVAIIGAGAAGLALGAALRRANVPVEIIEQNHDVGGLWIDREESVLGKNTHAVSPKSAQAFSDLPMPESWPDFPHHKQLRQYLSSYADHHRLRASILFGRAVKAVERTPSGWRLTLNDGETREYSDLALASGYHSIPNMPAYAGEFSGKLIHSRQYNGPESLIGKRVLVVGAGQSAMDILTDAVVAADRVFHSTRRAFVCVPRYVFGAPLEALQESPPPLVGDIFANLSLPKMFFVISMVANLFLWLNGLTHKKLGLPKYAPEGEANPPTLDQRVYGDYARGDIQHRPGIRRLCGNTVEFEDNSRADIDTIVCATGFKVGFPFMPGEYLNWPDGAVCPVLHRNIFHPLDDHLFCIGLVHPIGAHWRVFERQSALVASFLMARDTSKQRLFRLHRISSNLTRRAQSDLTGRIGSGLMVNKQNYLAGLDRDLNILCGPVSRGTHSARRRFRSAPRDRVLVRSKELLN